MSVVILKKGCSFPSDSRLVLFVLLSTCRLAGTHSVDGHSCCHGSHLLKFNNQQSVLHYLFGVGYHPLGYPKVMRSEAVGEQPSEVLVF